MKKKLFINNQLKLKKTTIEQVKPTIHEDVKVEQQHVYQKLAPEFQQANVQYVQENQQEMRQQ